MVSNETGQANFWVSDDGADSDWGASEFKDEKNENNTAKEVVVDKFDMPSFMKNVRELTEPGFKLMKMDIEGGEYTVLPPLVDQELLCEDTLNTLTIEWHRGPGELTLGSLPQVWAFEKKVQDDTRCDPKPTTEVLSFDDESFREDGVPIPGFEDESDANPEGHHWKHAGTGDGMHAGSGVNCRGKNCDFELEERGGTYHPGTVEQEQ